MTEFPIGDILRNKDAAGRISMWAIELGALDISFAPRTTIKSQALVDFMTEWMEVQDHRPAEKIVHWTMYFDGLMKMEGVGAGVLFISPKGE